MAFIKYSTSRVFTWSFYEGVLTELCLFMPNYNQFALRASLGTTDLGRNWS